MTSAPVTVDVVAAALSATQGLVEEDWGARDAELVLRDMADLERMQAHLDAARIALSQLIVDRQVAERAGWADAKDFLTSVARGHKGSGPGLVRLMKRLATLPATRAALAEGRLSRAQAMVITNKLATLPRHPGLREAAERLLLEGAAHLDATDLAGSWSQVLAQIDPDGRLLGSEQAQDKLERAAHRARFLSFSPDQVGGVRLRGYATLEEAELVKTALHALAAPVTTEPGACGGDPSPRRDLSERRRSCPDPECAHDGKDPRDHGARLWDALVEACDRLQTAEVLPTSHGASPRLSVTTTLDQLLAGLELPGGSTLSAAAVRRLACDAEVIPAVLGGQSQILDVGRASRLVTPAIWHALVLRDQHCAFPGCTRTPRACDAHHIVHWADGGTTALSNLLLLCRRHHTLTHHSPWQVRIDHDTGRPIWTPPPDTGTQLRIRRWDPGGLAA